MSVKELKLIGLGPSDAIIREKEFDDNGNKCIDEYEIELCGRKNGGYPKTYLVLDRSQAGFLKLWLEEHLK